LNTNPFLDELTSQIQPLALKVSQAYWELNTQNSPDTENRYSRTKKQLLQVYSDPALFRDLKKLRETCTEPVTFRQLDLLYHAFLINQLPPELIEEIIDQENEIESDFVNFRAKLDEKVVSDNDLRDLLANTSDNDLARRVWETNKQIGPLVAPKIIQLVELRNKSARILGFENFFQLSLFTNELDQKELVTLLNNLARLTEKPFQQLKNSLDLELGTKFGLSPSELNPWNYGDPFFQEIPKSAGLDLDDWFKKDLVEAASRFYWEIGLEPASILKKSDLYERPGKSQHAFCTDIDQAGDVRILCNLRPNEYWMNTLLHELGHGVYDLYRDGELPYFLKTPAHILTTEAIAMMMGRLTKDPRWLQEYLQAPASEIEKVQLSLQKELIKGELIFIRWGLVMVNFELELYRDPRRDLNTLWWDLVESYQKITRPAGRNQPDWATKIHIGTAPVYYQNYILGELAASQILLHLQKDITKGSSLIQNRASGKYLAEHIFAPGAKYPWNQLIKQATGDWLNPQAFMAEVTSVKF
jgi:peptidyl-dipeptidase A